MKVLTRSLIKEAEEKAVRSGAFSWRELMFSAGSSAAKIITEKFDCKNKNICVFIGKGNNGGDGCVIAKELQNFGANVSIILPFGTPLTENATYYFEKLKNIPEVKSLPENTDIIIDAIFGIGLDRVLDEKTVSLIEEINKRDAIRISVDIPSGMDCDSGAVLGASVKADLTITFIALKPCFLLPRYSGETVVADIGINPERYDYLTIEKPVFKKRAKSSHKGTFGTALMLCGSYGMAGAAILSGKAALRSGVGILKAVLCDGIYQAFTSSLPEAVCIPVKQTESGTLSLKSIDFYNINNYDALLIGCGLGNNKDTRELTRFIIKNTEVPLIIDADGINSIIPCIDIIKKSKAPVILTPHPGEMARMMSVMIEEIENNRIKHAKAFATEYGCTLVLKGANTIVADKDGSVYFNTTGNAGMATGGSGDVLSGIILSLLAQGFSPLEASKAGVFLHGTAGDKAKEKRSEHALLPSDIIEEL